MAGADVVPPEGSGLDAQAAQPDPVQDSAVSSPADSSVRRKFRPLSATLRWLTSGLILLVLALLALIAWLHTAPGRQFIVDEIAKVAPASGLTVEVGRIEG